MDSRRFDDLVSQLATRLSRRQGLGLLASLGVGVSLLAEDAGARKRKKHKKGKGKKGNKPAPCTPESQATTCAKGCGTQTNNCNQSVTCSCSTLGDSCLPNGTCARVCTSTTQCEDLSCGPQKTACGAPSAEGPSYCVNYFGDCSTYQVCGPQASTRNCPQGFVCQADCGGVGPHCYPVSVCPPAP